MCIIMIATNLLIIFFGGISFTVGDQHIAPSRGDHYSSSYSSPSYGSHGGGHYGGLHSFFDIALTGLAFLSFGTFLLNLLMNALFGGGFVTGTLLPTNGGTGIITLTDTGNTGIVTGITPTGGRSFGNATETTRSKRQQRDIFNLAMDPITSADNIAALVLKSIDAMVKEHECVQKVFCDGNKEARIVGKGFQYLMPAYSLGASYIAQKIGLHKNLPDHVSAILHGIEESNCESHFPQC